MALTRPDYLPARHTPAMVVPPATASASQRGCEAAGGPAAGLHQPAGADPGEDGQGPRICLVGTSLQGGGEAGSHPAHHALSIRPSR